MLTKYYFMRACSYIEKLFSEFTFLLPFFFMQANGFGFSLALSSISGWVVAEEALDVVDLGGGDAGAEEAGAVLGTHGTGKSCCLVSDSLWSLYVGQCLRI